MSDRVEPPPPADISANELFSGQPRSGAGMSLRRQLPSLLVNAVAPFVAFQVLTAQGVSEIVALATSGVFPAAGTAWSFLRTRRADVIGLVSLVFIVAGVLAGLVSGDPRFLLAKDSLMTGAFGLVFLGSLVLAPRPLIFYFGRQFVGGGDPVRTATFESLWQYPRFRAVNRRMTMVWGVGYLVEALVRVGLTFVLPIPIFLIVSPLLALGVTIALISWTMRYARRSSARAISASPPA